MYSFEFILVRFKGCDLLCILIKCYYFIYIYKFIYYILYDGCYFFFINKKKKYSIYFFVVGGVIVFNGF